MDAKELRESINVLKKAGLVKIDENNNISVTEKGEELVNELKDLPEDIQKELVGITFEELKALLLGKKESSE